jgi:periplasmic protein TonB
MASPEEIAPFLPETLPDDFGEWDSEASPAPEPAKPGEWEAWEAAHTHGDPSKSGKQTADRAAFLASLTDRPRVWNSSSSSSVVKQQKEVVDWDSEAPSSPSTVKSGEWEAWVVAHSFDTDPKPAVQSANREATLAPVTTGAAVADKPRVSTAPASAPSFVEKQGVTSEPVNGLPTSAPHDLETIHATNQVAEKPRLSIAAVVDGKRQSSEPAATVKHENGSPLLQLFSAKTSEVDEEQKPAKKKQMIIAGVGGGSIALLAILSITLFHHGSNPAPKPAIQPVTAATDPQPETSTSDPQSSDPQSANPSNAPVAQNQPAATTEKQQAASSKPGSQVAGAKPAQPAAKTQAPTETQAKNMNDQLAAPTRIPQSNAEQVAENAPPAGFGAAGADGLGGTNADASPFDGHGQPAVKVVPAKTIVISSGVAAGMLMVKTLPVYPAIAKSARVSGTVELHATISKNGSIKDLHVVSGSPMLQQAAVDAVRTWRYKPYMLNDAPTEVETTIRVVFSPIK